MDPVTHPRASKETLLFTASTVLLLAGGLAWLLSAQTPARVLWILGTVLGLGFSVVWTVDAIRRRQLSVDIIAVLALAGALAVNVPFAGAMITVMLASGQLLEARAAARASSSCPLASITVIMAPAKGTLTARAPARASTAMMSTLSCRRRIASTVQTTEKPRPSTVPRIHRTRAGVWADNSHARPPASSSTVEAVKRSVSLLARGWVTGSIVRLRQPGHTVERPVLLGALSMRC